MKGHTREQSLIKSALAALVAGSLTFTSLAASAEVSQAQLDAVAADLQSRVDAGKLSGAVVMVAQDGEVLMTEAMGYQNVEDQVPMQTDTIFRIFSASFNAFTQFRNIFPSLLRLHI